MSLIPNIFDQTIAILLSVSLVGLRPSLLWKLTPIFWGLGRDLRSTLPLGKVGRESNTSKLVGTI